MKLFSLFLAFRQSNGLVLNSTEVESTESGTYNDYGIVEVDCASSYFRPGGYWPLESSANAGKTVRLCQNVFGKPHKYATLYSVDNRIPVYSAGKFKRDPNGNTNPRPNDTWDHLAMGLCVPDGFRFPSGSFYSNFKSVSKGDHDYCAVHQATNDDYKGNISTLKIDRGHLLPNGIRPDYTRKTIV